MAYVELDLVKQSLRLEDDSRDELLQLAIDAAASAIETRCGGRTFGRAEGPAARRYLVGRRLARTRSGERLLVDDIADPAGVTVEADGVPISGWELLPENADVRGRPYDAITLDPYGSFQAYRVVQVTAVYGWPQVPAAIKQANLLQAVRLYRRKDSPEGIAGSAEWGLIRVPNLDPDVRALVEPYRRPAFGA